MFYGAVRGEKTPEEKRFTGMPFLSWEEGWKLDEEDGVFSCSGSFAGIYLLGGYCSRDIGTGGWWDVGQDRRNNLFVSDQIGTMEIWYQDGTMEEIPFIMGVNCWWSALWNSKESGFTTGNYMEPFRSDEGARKILYESLCLSDVFSRDEDCVNPVYWSYIKPKDVPVKRLVFIKGDEKNGYPVIQGITLEGDEGQEQKDLIPLSLAPSQEAKDWAEKICVTGDFFAGKEYKEKLDCLDRLLNCHKDQLPPAFYRSIPEDFWEFGAPGIDFYGNRYAEMLTNIYYNNVAGLFDKTDSDGRCYCSSSVCSYGCYNGFGTWDHNPSRLLGDDKPDIVGSWSRDTGVVLEEMAELGMIDRAGRAGDWNLLASRMAKPPHWSEQGNAPEGRHEFYRGKDKQTIGGQEEFGNRENDGQGLLLLALYHIWIHSGKKTRWIKERYPQILENLDWICMQLENLEPVMNVFQGPRMVERVKDLLYTESECSNYGKTDVEIYSNYICCTALRAGAEFAAAVGDSENEKKFLSWADRMERAILERFVVTDPKYGKVFQLTGSIWPAQGETLAPAFIYPDYFGWDLKGMPNELRTAAKNTLMMLMGDEKRSDFGNAMGYGQAFIAQAALYLDCRREYTALMETAALQCYYPGHRGWEWHVPEGCIMSEDGEKWHRLGDLGNAVQQASIIKCIRVMCGIDDTDPGCLSILPRLLEGFRGMKLKNYPVAVLRDGETEKPEETQILHLDVEYTLSERGETLTLKSEKPLGRVRFRSARPEQKCSAVVNGVKIAAEDGWIQFAHENTTRVEILYEA